MYLKLKLNFTVCNCKFDAVTDGIKHSVNSSKVGTPANQGLKQSSRNLDQSGGM